jgi:heme-degrading monooxygenase HmoA
MTIIKINAITVPDESGDELAHRFAARAGAVDDQEGFEGFELLKPTDDRSTWLVLTRWRDEESFQAWLSSPAFAHGHRSEGASSEGQGPQGGQSHAAHGHGGAPGGEKPPVAVHSELWSYEFVLGSPGGAG